MKAQPSKSGGRRAPSAKQDSRRQRDFAQNKRSGGSAPFGRLEDKSALKASGATKNQIKRGAAEGPKKSSPVKRGK